MDKRQRIAERRHDWIRKQLHTAAFCAPASAGSFVNEFVVDGAFYVLGKMFVNALKMMVVPLVLFSLICGVCGIGDVRLLAHISEIGCQELTEYLVRIANKLTRQLHNGVGAAKSIPRGSRCLLA